MASNPYKLNSGMRCVKYMLFIINFMFLLTALLLILVGTTIHSIYSDFKSILDLSDFTSPTTLLVAVGVILLLVSIFGCIGAIRESTLLINLYGVLLFFIFILEIAAAITAFALQGNIRGMIEKDMREAIGQYQTNKYAQDGIDFMQSQLGCCGVQGPDDWQRIFNETKIPLSCCEVPPQDDVCEKPFISGCLNRMVFVISQSAMLLATGASTVAFVQILGVICAFMLAKTIRRTKSMRAAKRWQLQQSLGILTSGGKNVDTGYTQLNKSTTSPETGTYEAKEKI